MKLKKLKAKFIPIIGGFSVGIVNGMLGAGGGMLAVPLLKISGLSQKSAHANSVAVILPLSIFSAFLYISSGRVSISDSLIYIPWGLAGAIVGTFVLRKIKAPLLKKIFAIVMIWAGFRLLVN